MKIPLCQKSKSNLFPSRFEFWAEYECLLVTIRVSHTAQKMKFSIKNFVFDLLKKCVFGLLKKSLMGNFIFCAVVSNAVMRK